MACKNAIDSVVARGMKVFPIGAYKDMEVTALKNKQTTDIPVVNSEVTPQDTEPEIDVDEIKPAIKIVKKDGGDINAN